MANKEWCCVNCGHREKGHTYRQCRTHGCPCPDYPDFETYRLEVAQLIPRKGMEEWSLPLGTKTVRTQRWLGSSRDLP